MCLLTRHFLRQGLSYPTLESNSLCSRGRPWVSDSFAYCTHSLLLLVLQIHTTCLALPSGRVHGWALFMIDKSSTNGTTYISSPPPPGHSIPLYLPLPQYTKSLTGSQIRFTNRNPKPLWGKVLRRANESEWSWRKAAPREDDLPVLTTVSLL